MLYETQVPGKFRKGKVPKCKTVGELIRRLKKLPKEMPLSGSLDPSAGVSVVTPICLRRCRKTHGEGYRYEPFLTCDILQDDDGSKLKRFTDSLNHGLEGGE